MKKGDTRLLSEEQLATVAVYWGNHWWRLNRVTLIGNITKDPFADKRTNDSATMNRVKLVTMIRSPGAIESTVRITTI